MHGEGPILAIVDGLCKSHVVHLETTLHGVFVKIHFKEEFLGNVHARQTLKLDEVIPRTVLNQGHRVMPPPPSYPPPQQPGECCSCLAANSTQTGSYNPKDNDSLNHKDDDDWTTFLSLWRRDFGVKSITHRRQTSTIFARIRLV